MDEKSAKSSRARNWWLLAGGIVVLVVTFDLVERLVRTESGPDANGPPSAEDAAAAETPFRPEVRKLEDGGIEIRLDLFRRTTIRLANEADERELLDCLERGFEQAFGDGSAGWSRARVRRETQRIQEECTARFFDLPAPPRLPGPTS